MLFSYWSKKQVLAFKQHCKRFKSIREASRSIGICQVSIVKLSNRNCIIRSDVKEKALTAIGHKIELDPPNVWMMIIESLSVSTPKTFEYLLSLYPDSVGGGEDNLQHFINNLIGRLYIKKVRGKYLLTKSGAILNESYSRS